MADAAAECANAAANAKFSVDRHAMLVPPEPEHRARKEFGKLPGWLRVPIIVRGIILLVRQENDSAWIIVARPHNGAKPINLLGAERAGRLKHIF
jgi:hypothetical protein